MSNEISYVLLPDFASHEMYYQFNKQGFCALFPQNYHAIHIHRERQADR